MKLGVQPDATPTHPTASRRQLVWLLAGMSGLDPRTVSRALKFGASALRAEIDQLRIEDAAKRLGITLGGAR